MNKQTGRSGSGIAAVFPIMIMMLFAVSTVAVLLLSVNLYGKIDSAASDNYNTRTCASYITEKVRQTDVSGSIRAGILDDSDCLILTQKEDNSVYQTYIYEYDGSLREMRALEGTTFSAASGTVIGEIGSFDIVSAGKSTYRIDLSTPAGEPYSVVVAGGSDI